MKNRLLITDAQRERWIEFCQESLDYVRSL